MDENYTILMTHRFWYDYLWHDIHTIFGTPSVKAEIIPILGMKFISLLLLNSIWQLWLLQSPIVRSQIERHATNSYTCVYL